MNIALAQQTAKNLAPFVLEHRRALEEIHRRVLVIDADRYQRHDALTYGVPRGPGVEMPSECRSPPRRVDRLPLLRWYMRICNSIEKST